MNNSKNGRLIIVVGPSGAGKDSILKAAQAHFQHDARVEFVRRIITRECDPTSEVHDSVTEAQFIAARSRGDFSVSWQANGLYYALPANLHEKIARSQLLIANGSRAAMGEIRSSFPSLTVVQISASAKVLAERLALRSRESAEQIKQRMLRNERIDMLHDEDVLTIDNSAARQSAIDEFVAVINAY